MSKRTKLSGTTERRIAEIIAFARSRKLPDSSSGQALAGAWCSERNRRRRDAGGRHG